MKFAFIQAEKASFPVALMCRRLDVSRSGYYAWTRRPESVREREDRRLAAQVAAIYQENRRRYGAPRVHEELKARGHRHGRKRIARLMRDNGLRARPRGRFVRTTDSEHGHPVAANVLNRDFSPQEPARSWAGDITYIWTSEGWLYLAVILDLFSRKVVGWSTSSRIDGKLVMAALANALHGRGPVDGLLHHSDRGSQYASEAYRLELARRGIRCSMSRRGNCWDNAVVESFFSSLKFEVVHDAKFETRDEVRRELFRYIEGFYNTKRRHSSLGYVSPAEYEQRALMSQRAA